MTKPLSDWLAKYGDHIVDTEAKAKLQRLIARSIVLPTPIGSEVFIPYRYKELDGSIDQGVEKARLCGGYAPKADSQVVYLLADGDHIEDYKPGEIFAEEYEAWMALAKIGDEAEDEVKSGAD